MFAALRSVVSTVDASVFHWVVNHRTPLLNPIMIVLGYGGALVWGLGTLLLALLIRRRSPALFQVALAVGLAALLADFAAKPLIARHRPFISFAEIEVMAKLQRSGSFPSTHAAGAFAAAFGLGRVLPEARIVFWGVAVLVAYARVYLGVHYPIDVIGGALVGIAAAAFVMAGSRWND